MAKHKISTDGGQSLSAENPFAQLSAEGLRPAPEPVPAAAEATTKKKAKGPVKRERVVMRMIKAGKGGKIVTEVSGFMPGRTDTTALLKFMQRKLGTGGTVKAAGVIELQGDCREAVRACLQAEGFTVAG